MASEKDFNVPVAGITPPSYQQDRLVRYLKWFDTYLKGNLTTLQAER